MKDLIIVGAGGHGRETAQLVKDINKQRPEWNLLGYVDDNTDLHGERLNGYPVLGPVDLLNQNKYREARIICGIGSSAIRKRMMAKIEQAVSSDRFATLIHPTAVVGDETKILPGTMICAHTVVTTNIRIGRHVIINYGSTIGHDSVIEDYATVLPGTHISGNVTIKREAELGTGSAVIPGVHIGEGCIVGAGAVVIKDLPAFCTAVGLPARPIKNHNQGRE